MIKQGKFNLEEEIFLDLSYKLELPAVAKQIRLRSVENSVNAVAADLIAMVEPVARPKAVYRPLRPKHLDDSGFEVDRTRFSSRVLSKLLAEDSVVFPYIVTIGPELAALDLPHTDMVGRYRLDAVKSMVLHAAGRAFAEHLQSEYPGHRLTHMNPGEIDDWPLTQQRFLFSLFPGVEEKIGVTLTDGCMIKPAKSRSGIFFANEDAFETCRLCHQLKCPGRRAAYDASVIARYTA